MTRRTVIRGRLSMHRRPLERVRPWSAGDRLSGPLDQQDPRPRRDPAERFVDRTGPVHLDLPRLRFAETEDELRRLAAQIARPALQDLGAGTGAVAADHDLGTDGLPLALRGAQPDLEVSRPGRRGVVPVEAMALPLHLMDEQVDVAVVVEIGGQHG